MARGLGKEKLGEYSLVFGFYTLFILIFEVGISQTAIRFSSRAVLLNDRETQFQVLRWTFRIRLFLMLNLLFFSFLMAPFVAELWNSPHLTRLLRFSLLIGIVSPLVSIPSIYFQSNKQFKKNTLVLTIQSIFLFLGILFIEYFSLWDIKWIILINLLNTIFSGILCYLLVPSEIFFSKSEIKYFWKKHFKSFLKFPIKENFEKSPNEIKNFILFMMLSTIPVVFIGNIDIWFMGRFVEKAEIGIYNVASKVTIPLTILLIAINTALWPRISGINHISEIRLTVKKMFKINFLLFFGAFIYSFFAPYFIPCIFGSQYTGGIFVAQLLSVKYALNFLIYSILSLGYNLGIVKYYWIINLLQLFFVVLINLIFLPIIGITASAFAQIIVEIINIIFITNFVLNKIKEKKTN